MADTPEGKVKKWLYGDKKKPGILFKYFPGAYVYKPPGGMFGTTGAPDCLLCWSGVFVGIEVKADGNTPTTPQLRNLRAIIAAGGIGAVITGYDESRLQAVKAAVMAKIEKMGNREPSPPSTV